MRPAVRRILMVLLSLALAVDAFDVAAGAGIVNDCCGHHAGAATPGNALPCGDATPAGCAGDPGDAGAAVLPDQGTANSCPHCTSCPGNAASGTASPMAATRFLASPPSFWDTPAYAGIAVPVERPERLERPPAAAASA
jgi:hypothetical protein